jgi:hypothetical protein
MPRFCNVKNRELLLLQTTIPQAESVTGVGGFVLIGRVIAGTLEESVFDIPLWLDNASID